MSAGGPGSAPHSVGSAPLSSGGAVAPLSATPGTTLSVAGTGPFVTPQVNTNDAPLREWRAKHNEKLKLQGECWLPFFFCFVTHFFLRSLSAAANSVKQADAELAKAKTELDSMTAAWEAKKKAQHAKNIEDETRFLAARDASKGHANMWNRVSHYVDLKVSVCVC